MVGFAKQALARMKRWFRLHIILAMQLITLGMCSPTAVHAADVYVVVHEKTRGFFTSNGGSHDLLSNRWRDGLARIGQPVQSASLAQLSKVNQPGVLILPSVFLLDDADRGQIKSLVASGWSILGTWATGSRDGAGGWLGYGFIEETFGAKIVADFDTRKSDGWFLLPDGESPVSFGLAAGERIYIPKISEPILTVTGAGVVARGGEWTRQSALLGVDRSGLVHLAEQGASRRVYWSFPETAWDASREQFDTLLRNSLSWLAREPTIVKSAWPHPYQAAYLVEMDTEDQFQNATHLAELFEARQWTGTFYVLTSLAINHPDVVKRLASKHEIGYHAEVHDGFKGLPIAAQEERLKNMVAQLGTVLPNSRSLTGFRAPLESFDANTEIALRRLGFTHHVSSPDSRSSLLPGFSTAEQGLSPDKALVVLPRTQLDDVNFVRMGLSDEVKMQKLLIEGASESIRMRGLGMLSVHTQYFGKNAPLTKAMNGFFDFLAASKAWVASSLQIEEWWRQRERVVLTSTSSAKAITFKLQNDGAAVRNFKLVLMAPSVSANPKLIGPASTQAVIQRLDNLRWAIVFNQLKQGTQQLTVQF